MRNVSLTEKYAIASILSQIMNADGIIHPKEVDFIDSVYSELGITIDDLQEVTNMDSVLSKEIITSMSNENKEYAKNLFNSMAASDGYIHPKETEIINQIFL